MTAEKLVQQSGKMVAATDGERVFFLIITKILRARLFSLDWGKEKST